MIHIQYVVVSAIMSYEYYWKTKINRKNRFVTDHPNPVVVISTITTKTTQWLF